MEKITVLPLMHDLQHYFVASDWHSYHMKKSCFNILCQMALMYPKKERRLIINGDFCDFAFLMPKKDEFKKWIKRSDGVEEFFLPEYEAEVQWANDMLDKLQEIFSEVIFIHGNHDGLRVAHFRETYVQHAYKHHFDLGVSMNLYKRGILEIGYNNWLDVGDMSITHGMFHGSTCHKKHYEAAQARSCLFGHVHHDNKVSFMARGKTVQAQSLPAMCDLNPDYVRNADLNWTNGFGTLHVKRNGHFNYHTQTIWDNELILSTGQVLRCEEEKSSALLRPF